MQPIENTILNRIYGHGRGWCFTPSDFLSVGSHGAVRITLLRLKRKKIIRQLATGLYDYPRTHPELGIQAASASTNGQTAPGMDRFDSRGSTLRTSPVKAL